MPSTTKATKTRLRPANGSTPSKVTVDTAAYVTLLIRANVTDPKQWPKGMKWGGAKALARIRDIERRCIARHGEFDWEKLGTRLQDEYDSLCAQLDEIRDTGERVSWEEYMTRRRGTRFDF